MRAPSKRSQRRFGDETVGAVGARVVVSTGSVRQSVSLNGSTMQQVKWRSSVVHRVLRSESTSKSSVSHRVELRSEYADGSSVSGTLDLKSVRLVVLSFFPTFRVARLINFTNSKTLVSRPTVTRVIFDLPECKELKRKTKKMKSIF